jgi:hypothetical protein
MWFRSLFDAWLAGSPRTPTSLSRRVPRVRPLLEILEDRTLLSTYTVDALTDTGTGSGMTGDLRYCITKATSGNDTITFAQGLTGTIQLQKDLPMNTSVAIQGPGAQLITVSGGNNYNWSVNDAARVQITGLTLSDSVIEIESGSATVSNSTLDAAIATDSTTNNAGVALTVSNCNLYGGIDNWNTLAALTVSNCNANTLISNAGSATISNSTVGAIHNYGSATVSYITISDGDIENTGSATISYLTMSDGYFSNTGSETLSYSTISGSTGGISNSGNLTINNSTISGNKAVGAAAGSTTSRHVFPAGDGDGGGIYTTGGTLSINSSTIADNEAIGGSTAGFGPIGGYVGNGYGGGLYIGGGMVTINNSTFADNQAIGGAGGDPGTGYGGGIYNAAGAGALQMHDTILADNTANVDPDLDGGVTSQGYNLIGNSSGGSGFIASDLLNVNPQLGTLQNNGGPTQTMALLTDSPAIDAGDNAGAPTYDQRGPGFPRIVNGTIDIGAFEVQNGGSTNPSSLAVTGFPSAIKAGNAGTFTVTALNADGTTDTGYTGTVQFSSSDALAGLPANYTFTTADQGVHPFSATLKTAGTQSITAIDTTSGGATGSDTGITVTPAAASTLSISGFPTSTTAGVAHTFTITLKDAFDNIATGYTGTVHFTSSDAQAVLPANYTFTAADAGVHTFTATLKKAGTQSLTVTDTATASLTGTQSGITVNAAAASKFILTAPASVNPGVPFSLTVTVEDAYGNVVVGYTGTIRFSSKDTTATLPANYTFTATDKGVHTFTGLVLRKKGNQKISVTDTQNRTLTGSAIVDVL